MSSNVNSVFYADSYHPIQAGSIDGTDTHPHDNAVYRALLCSNASLYDPFGDPKVIGDPYCTLFVGRLSHFTNEETIREAMSKYGHVKDLRLVRHVVTGASRGYAFVTFETEKEMRRAYKEAHHTSIDGSEILVDYNRQRLMPGWIPRRLGGGLGGKKESGQLRFGGRERPFRAPLKQIPYDELQKLGIPLPPEGKYVSRFQDKAGCVADEIANKLEHTPCSASNTTQSQVASNYPDVLKKCEVDPNSTRDGMILPVCVPGRVEALVLTNYTQSPQNSKYLNSSKFTGAGIGTEDDWTVLILTTGSVGGSYVSRVSRIAVTIGSGHYMVVVSVFLVMFLGSL